MSVSILDLLFEDWHAGGLGGLVIVNLVGEGIVFLKEQQGPIGSYSVPSVSVFLISYCAIDIQHTHFLREFLSRCFHSNEIRKT